MQMELNMRFLGKASKMQSFYMEQDLGLIGIVLMFVGFALEMFARLSL